MENFKIGDKVVFKKEVLDKISKVGYVKSYIGTSLTKEYYDYLMDTTNTNFKKLGYFYVSGTDVINDVINLFIGLYIGADLFEHYQEECSYKTDDEFLNKIVDSKKESNLTTTKNYQNNEIKFQRAKASSKRGVVPAGSTISGRKDKIAISIGHLSYQVCNC